LQKFSHSTKVEGEEIEIDTGWEYVWIAPDFGAIVLIDSEENEENPDFSMGTFNRTTAIGGVGVSSQVKSEIPSRSGLDSAYPNPFNPQTQLKFTVAQPGVVYIVIYDVNGKVISSVVDGFLNVGTYKTDFYATGLVSGVYFAKFSTGSFNQTQMLILNK